MFARDEGSPPFEYFSLVGKGPQGKKLFDAIPKFSQTPGFKNQETDDQKSKDHLLEGNDQFPHAWRIGSDHIGQYIQKFRD